MTKAIITGGAGFIGYHLGKKLLSENYEVSILDNFSDYYSVELKKQNAQELKELGAEIIEGSILNQKDLSNIIENDCDIVFHLAAQPGVRYSTLNPQQSLRINIEGTTEVLAISQKRNVKKIVISSSSSVFGSKQYLPIDENHPKNPISYYGVSKLATEKIVDVYRYLHKEMDISIIRPFTVVGARQRPDMALNVFVTKAFKNKTIPIYGDGSQTRDWTHASNIAHGFYLAATKTTAKNESFNIGSGISTSVNETLDLISEISGKKLKIDYQEFYKADVKDTLADIKKAKKLLGYQPVRTLREAIQEFIDDYDKIKSLY